MMISPMVIGIIHITNWIVLSSAVSGRQIVSPISTEQISDSPCRLKNVAVKIKTITAAANTLLAFRDKLILL